MMFSNITIESYSEEYDEFIETLREKSVAENIVMPLRNKKVLFGQFEYDSIVVALYNNQPVGVISFWNNLVHPLSLYFSIIVLPEYRRRKIGTSLYEYLKSIVIGYDYLQVSCYKSSEPGVCFLNNHNFLNYRTTYEIEYDVSSNKENKEKLLKLMNNQDITIKSLVDIGSKLETMNLFHLSMSCYKESHSHNPMGNIEMNRWMEFALEDLDKSGSFIILKNEEVIAFSLLHINDEESFDLGWHGTSHQYINSDLIEILIRKQIEYLKENQIKFLNFELDNTSRWSLPLLSKIGLEDNNPWLTYQFAL